MTDAASQVPWEEERCHYVGGGDRCSGLVVGQDGHCLAHTTKDARAAVLAAIAAGGPLSATRGVPLTSEILESIFSVATDSHGRITLHDADFSHATFNGVISFRDVDFIGSTRFAGAQFSRSSPALFSGCVFAGETSFAEAQFGSNLFMVGVTFRGMTTFLKARVNADTTFDGSTFEEHLTLYGLRVDGGLSLRGVTFHSAAELGPLLTTGDVSCGGATFTKATIVKVVAQTLSLVAAEFQASAVLHVRHAAIVLDLAGFHRPATIAFARSPFERVAVDVDETPLFDESLTANLRSERPALVSLSQVDAGNLTVVDIDLSSCLFHGAFNLDRIRIVGSRPFGRTPSGIQHGWRWPPIWRWTPRYALAEEGIWRAAQSRGGSAQGGWEGVPSALNNLSPERFLSVMEFRTFEPGAIATVYRSLRKAFEDAKDEPGAADFYYGEMEMRRLDPDTSRSERLLLTLYWLVSGYGLRGSRSLMCLLLVIGCSAAALFQWGFTTEKTVLQSLIYSANSTTSLLRPAETPLTNAGQVIEMFLRLVGALLFGLLLVSMRGRVKR